MPVTTAPAARRRRRRSPAATRPRSRSAPCSSAQVMAASRSPRIATADRVERQTADGAGFERRAGRGILRRRRSRRPTMRGDHAELHQLAHRVARAHAAQIGHRAGRSVGDQADDRRRAASAAVGRRAGVRRRADQHRRLRIDRRSRTPRYRSVASAIRLNTGADTEPPVVGPACGESVTTMIATAGLRDGMKPTNDAL